MPGEGPRQGGKPSWAGPWLLVGSWWLLGLPGRSCPGLLLLLPVVILAAILVDPVAWWLPIWVPASGSGVSWALQLPSWAPWPCPGWLWAVPVVSWSGSGPRRAPVAVWPVMAGCDPGPWPVILAVILVDPVLEGSRSDVQRAGEGVSWWPWPRPGLPGKVPNLGTWLFSRIFSKGEFFLRSKPYEVGPWLAPVAVGRAPSCACTPVRT